MNKQQAKNFILVMAVVLVGALLYAGTLRGDLVYSDDVDVLDDYTQRGQAFESSHERATYAAMVSILRDKSISLSKELADFGSPDIGYEDGRFFSFFPPGMSVSMMPLYLLGQPYGWGQLLSFSTSAIFALLSLFFIYLISRNVLGMDPWRAALSMAIFAFATVSWNYAITIYQHSASALFMLAGFYAVWKYSQEKPFSWGWGAFAWLNYALAIAFDYPNAFLMLPIMFYFLYESLSVSKVGQQVKVSFRPAIVATFIVFLAVTSLNLYHNKVGMGSYTKIAQSMSRYTTNNYDRLLEKERLAALGTTEDDDDGSSNMIAEVFSEEDVPTGLQTLLFATDKGLFLFSPVLLLALAGIYSLRRRIDAPIAVLLMLVVTNIMIYASFSDPWGGWAYGPRYLVPAMSILAIFVPVWISGRWLILKKVVAFALIAVSAAFAVMGVLTTNLVPPKVEAVYLKINYGLSNNWELINSGMNSSFVYNRYLSDSVEPIHYAYGVLAVVLAVCLVLVAFIPRRQHED